VPGAMLGFQDATQTIDERKEARMNFQTKPRIKSTIRTNLTTFPFVLEMFLWSNYNDRVSIHSDSWLLASSA